MASQSYKRKLAAILSADVKGYSRLMSEDEAYTIGTLTEYRELMSVLIRKHRGRVVDSAGDNLLAEFASVVDAVGGVALALAASPAVSERLSPSRKGHRVLVLSARMRVELIMAALSP